MYLCFFHQKRKFYPNPALFIYLSCVGLILDLNEDRSCVLVGSIQNMFIYLFIQNQPYVYISICLHE